MARYNRRTTAVAKTAPVSFITTEVTPSGHTFEGAPGFARDAKSELFLLAVSTFLTGDKSFYEGAAARDTRFANLVRTVAVTYPLWTAAFLRWLRTDANIRTAALTGAMEAAAAMVKAKITGSRSIVSSVLLRPDEPGEALAYWLNTHKRQIPKPIKRGIADAAQRLYTQYGFLKYDGSATAVSFADVLELCHVSPSGAEQQHLFQYILGRRFNKELKPDWKLTMLRRNQTIRTDALERPEVLFNPDLLQQAGMTWEAAQSLLGTLGGDSYTKDQMKRALWQGLAPTMGYMALLRNLRNLSDAHVNDETIRSVIRRLTDPAEVAKSRQFPFRFLSAYIANKHNLTWASALERALQLSLQNVPELPGRTLILVDISGSMDAKTSYDSAMTRAQLAGLFGTALAVSNKGRASLFKYDSVSELVTVRPGTSILTMMKNFVPRGGTYTAKAVRETYQGHDRVVILTDEQASDGDPGAQIPSNVPLYTWNLAGYKYGHSAGRPLRYTFGGLTDQAWRLIPLLEAGQSQQWPFTVQDGIVTPTASEDDE